ncbi:four helix bundle protein [Candidatus Saccharibacteria bacterium]|nr:four helix bundle protein [Candidatus Saccharibacteria bacterium]
MGVQSYKELVVWKKSVELVKTIYEITKNFPQSEQFGITSQMRRAGEIIKMLYVMVYRK